MANLIEGIIVITILIFSAIFHEIAHGWMAYILGDKTAKESGRLTLNPISHIDPLGSIILPGFLVLMNALSGGRGIIFGWAKPVPINPFNLKDKRFGSAKIAAAGPLSNIILALIFGFVLRFGAGAFGLIPESAIAVFVYIVQINLILAVFNLMPIPPLDGSHILFSFLPGGFGEVRFFLMRYGMMFVIFFIAFFGNVIFAIVNFLTKIIIGI